MDYLHVTLQTLAISTHTPINMCVYIDWALVHVQQLISRCKHEQRTTLAWLGNRLAECESFLWATEVEKTQKNRNWAPLRFWESGNMSSSKRGSSSERGQDTKLMVVCVCVCVTPTLVCSLFVFVPFCMGAGSHSLSFALKWWEPTQRERSLWYLKKKQKHREVWTQLCDSGPATPTSVYFTPQDSALPKDRNRHITSSCLVCTTTELQLCFVCPHTISNGDSQTSSQHLCKNNVNLCLWRSQVAHRLEAYDGEGVCTPLDVYNPW